MKIKFWKQGDFGRGFNLTTRWQRCYDYPEKPEYASQLSAYILFWKWVIGFTIYFKTFAMDKKYWT